MITEPTQIEQRYMFEPAWQAEQRRLVALETIWDANTFAHLDALNLPENARCLEVGGGNGSVAAWLCRRVGAAGHVVATDLDTRFLATRTEANLEVRSHDIVEEPLEAAAYDLVHTRLLLSHLPGHLQALQRMAEALKPGGWLVVEEFDHVSFLPDPASDAASQAVWAAWMDAFERLAQKRGLDLSYGRRLKSLFGQRGLEDVRAEGQTVLEHGGVEGRELLLLSTESLRGSLVETGAIDNTQIDRLVEMLSDPCFMWQSQIMVTAKGRRAAR